MFSAGIGSLDGRHVTKDSPEKCEFGLEILKSDIREDVSEKSYFFPLDAYCTLNLPTVQPNSKLKPALVHFNITMLNLYSL